MRRLIPKTSGTLASILVMLIGLTGGRSLRAQSNAVPSKRIPSNAAQALALWGSSPARNNVARESAAHLEDWAVPEFDAQRRIWKPDSGRRVRWAARVGNPTHGSPVVASGRVLIGSNNAAAHLRRYPADTDLGCLLCFRESDGQLLWQYSANKHPGGRVHDWPNQGVCSTPMFQGDRAWFVDNLGRVVCVDIEGFGDGEDDGPDQGIAEVIATADSLLELSLWRVPPTIRDAFQRIGVTLGSCTIGVEKNGEWLVRSRYEQTTSGERFFLRREAYELVAYRHPERPRDKLDEPLFRVDNRLFPGLEDDKFGPELHDLLRRHDITVPAASSIRTEIAGKAWSFVTGEGDAAREYSLKMDAARRLVISMKARQGDVHDADVVWRLDMPNQLGVFPHVMSNCSPVAWGDVLFVGTSNGVDESHHRVPAPDAPSFLALDKLTGEVLWSDASPGERILHGQWSSPAVAVLGGVPQVIFAGGDGWVYSFRADQWDREAKRPIRLWQFDCNPKESKLIVGGRGTRNTLVATPVIHEGLVYMATGDDPEHGEGDGHLWCIDPTRRGDVSPQLVRRMVDGQAFVVPPRRVTGMVREEGEFAVDNPNSAAVWQYARQDRNGDGKMEFDETMHRAIATAVVKDGLLFIPDYSGLLHCLDARTGKCHWTSDLRAACLSSPLVVGDRVVVCDEDGDVAVFALSAATRQVYEEARGNRPAGFSHHEPIVELRLNLRATATPMFANKSLFLADGLGLYAIAVGE